MQVHAYEPAADEDIPGSLQWRERADRHWIATSAAGGHYEIVPEGASYRAWRMPFRQTPQDLGTSPTLGGAMMACRRDLQAIMDPSKAAQGASEGGCLHTHPPGVPSAPCADPSHVTVIEQTRATATRTKMVAAEGARPRGGKKVTIACEAPAQRAERAAASEAGPYETASRDPHEVEAGRAMGVATSPKAIYAMVAPSLSKESQEVFLTIPLDLRGQPLSRPVEVARGQNDHVTVEPSDILAPAVEKKAKGFVAVHVHPSGHAKPSAADVRLTRAIEQAARIMRIEFLDHVIVASSASRGEYFSFRENGYFGGGRPRRTPLVHQVSRDKP